MIKIPTQALNSFYCLRKKQHRVFKLLKLNLMQMLTKKRNRLIKKNAKYLTNKDVILLKTKFSMKLISVKAIGIKKMKHF